MNDITDHDLKMMAMGYLYRLTPKDGSFEPVYAKNMANVSSLMRDTYPRVKFTIRDLSKNPQEAA